MIAYDDSPLESAIWAILDDSACADDFRSYLRQFRDGAHRHEAVERIVALDDDDGAADDKPHYAEAFAVIKAAAESGQGNAQFHLGKALSKGIGTDKDAEAGERWYRLAIRQGELRAHINLCLAILASTRRESSESIAEALALAEAAAAQGDANGLSILAGEKRTGKRIERDIAGAVELLQSALAADDGQAGMMLARMFLYGEGVTPNPEYADDCARLAAEAGHGDACYHLGFCAERDAKSPGDAHIAKAWYEKGAANLDPDCVRQLGLMLLRAEHIPKDGAAGVTWLKRAAALGDAEAMRDLGITYLHGIDVVRNGAFAFKWFSRALAAGDRRAAEYLGHCYEQGVGVTADADAATVNFEIAARAGSASAQRCLATALLKAQGERRDPTRASRWLHLAILQKDARAMALLGRMHEYGDGLPADPARAVALYRRAAEAGDTLGQECLGTCCLGAIGTAFDPAEAAYWLDQATQAGSPQAHFLIGLMFQRGLGVDRDAGAASSWFLDAAEAGHGRAQCELGRMYLEGDGLAINLDEAERWLQSALAAEIEEAGPLLERVRMCRSVQVEALQTPAVVASPSDGEAGVSRQNAIVHPFRVAATASPGEIESV